MFILFYHSMNAEQSFDNLPFSGVNQEKPHDKKFKITIHKPLWKGSKFRVLDFLFTSAPFTYHPALSHGKVNTQFIYITSLFRNGHISWFSTSRKVCRYPTGKPHEGKAACQQTWGTVCSFSCPWSTLLHWTTVRQPWKWQEVWDTWWKRIGLKGRTTAVIHLLAKATRALPAGPLARKLASFCSHHLWIGRI